MLFATIGQAYVFLATMYGGVAIGLVQDLLHSLHTLLHMGKFVSQLLDWVFWLVVGAIAFFVLLWANDGELRLYTLLGFLVGWALYQLSLHRIVHAVLTFLWRCIRRAFRFLLGLSLVKKILR